MKRNTLHRRLLLLAVFPALLQASCTREETGNEPDTQRGEIRFEIGFAPTDTAPSHSGLSPDRALRNEKSSAQHDRTGSMTNTLPATRVATDTKFRSTWEEGDAIGLFAAESGSAPAATGNPIHNVKLTYSSRDGGTWTAAEPLYWPMEGKKLDFYAYYPYDETRTDPLAIPFSVPADQSAATAGGPAYNRHDLLMAKAHNEGKGFGKGETVALNFSHALAMVQVNVSQSMIGDYPPEALIVRLDGCATDCMLNLSLQATARPSELPLTEIIKMYPCPHDGGAPGVFAYRALVPAQAVAAGTALFSFEYGGSTLLRSRPLTQVLPLSPGRAETFDMTFPFTSVAVSDTQRLANLLPGDELATISHLKVLGEMTQADFFTIRDGMPSIVSLDLGGATVKGDTIPDRALKGKTGLQEFIFPRGIRAIGHYAFMGCNDLTGSLIIPEGVKTIGNDAFQGCSGFDGTLTIPGSVTTINPCAFLACSGLTGSLTIPGSVTTIGRSAFLGCNGFNGTLTICEGVQIIFESAFEDCSGLTGSLTIPGSVTTIGSGAFQYCNGFDGPLTIPASVTTIGSNAFYACISLSSITCHIPRPTAVKISTSVFTGIPATIPVYVPPASVTEYKNHSTWSGFSNILPIPQP